MTKIQTYTGEYLEQTLEEILEDVVRSIKSKFPESKVILFGSYARGDYSKDSDLDICVLVPKITKNLLEMKGDIRAVIRDIIYDCGLSFDLKLYSHQEFNEKIKSPNEFAYNIHKEGLVLR